MSQVLAIGHRVTRTYLGKRARMTVKSGAQNRAVTLIQSFRSALNLNLHFHMLYLKDGFTPGEVFGGCYQLDIILWSFCAGTMRVVADITDPHHIRSMLDHIAAQASIDHRSNQAA
jgi:hypothetical protein